MYLYQYALLAGFVCLLFNKEARFAAVVFIFAWSIYLLDVISMNATTYYAATATIEMCIGFILNPRFRVVSILSYMLMLLNIYGLMFHYDDMGRAVYINLYAIISVTQFLFLLTRAIPNGISRLPDEHWLVRCVDYDSRQARVIMYKSKNTKESNR